MPRGTQPAARAGAVVAGADNPHALWYNPAGLVESKKQFVFDLTLPIQRTEFTQLQEDGTHAPTVKAPSAPLPIPTLAYTNNFGLEDWGFGWALLAPVAASPQWPDKIRVDGQTQRAPQRYSILDTDGTAFASLLLGAGYQPVEWLRLGASAVVSFAQVGGRVAVSACDFVLCSQPLAPEWEAESQFLLRPQVLFGGIFGATLDFGIVRVGASLALSHFGRGDAVSGTADFDVALPDNLFFDEVTVDGDRAQVSADLPMIVRGGIEVRPTPALRVEVGGTWQEWSVQDEIAVEPIDVVVQDIPTLGSVDAQAVSLERNMRDTFSVNLGGEYTWQDLFPKQRDFGLSAGVMYERGAFGDAWLSPVSPDTDKVLIGLGLTVQVTEHLLLDATFGHIFMRNRNVTDSEVLLPTVIRPEPGGPGDDGFDAGERPRIANGKYRMEANFIGAGLRWMIPEL